MKHRENIETPFLVNVYSFRKSLSIQLKNNIRDTFTQNNK